LSVQLVVEVGQQVPIQFREHNSFSGECKKSKALKSVSCLEQALFQVVKSTISTTDHHCPARDRLPVFLILDDAGSFELVERFGQRRRGIADKNECPASESIGIPKRIGSPQIVLAPAITDGQTQRVDGWMAFAIKTHLAGERPARGSEDRFNSFGP